ncbi:MAG: histidine decarboxylase, partial [Verrucomicrobiota bacterium]
MTPLSIEERKQLDDLFAHCLEQRSHFAGYPVNTRLDYGELFRFLEFPLNNVGDPFREGTYGLQTHAIEREVIEWFGEVLHAEPSETWGY